VICRKYKRDKKEEKEKCDGLVGTTEWSGNHIPVEIYKNNTLSYKKIFQILIFIMNDYYY